MNTESEIKAMALIREASQLAEQGFYVKAYMKFSEAREHLKIRMESLPKRDLR